MWKRAEDFQGRPMAAPPNMSSSQQNMMGPTQGHGHMYGEDARGRSMGGSSQYGYGGSDMGYSGRTINDSRYKNNGRERADSGYHGNTGRPICGQNYQGNNEMAINGPGYHGNNEGGGGYGNHGWSMDGHRNSRMSMDGHGQGGSGNVGMSVGGQGGPGMSMGGPGRSEMPMGGPGRSEMPMGGPGRSEMSMGGPGRSEMPMGGPGRSEMPMGGPRGQERPMGGPGGSGMPMNGPGMHRGGQGAQEMPMGGPGGSEMSMGGPGGPGNAGMGGFGNQQPEGNSTILSSINALSQMSAQQTDIASKILTAVLSTNLIGNLSQQQGNMGNPNVSMENIQNMMGCNDNQGMMGNEGPPFQQVKMVGFNERKPFRGSRSRSRSPRRFRQAPERGGFDRFSRERRGTSPRAGNRTGYESRRRASGAREVRGPPRVAKKSWADSSHKEENSRFKRRRSSPDDKADKKTKREVERDLDEGKKNLSSVKSSNGEKTKDRKDPKKLDGTPMEALKCHMCSYSNFTSEETYLFHLEGVRHKKAACAFHAKNDATLEFLRKNAKLAGIRFGGMDKNVNPSRCALCTATVFESFFKHKKLFEHKIVKRFMEPSCCGRQFRNRYELEEHRLSLPHLRKAYENNQKKEVFLEDCNNEDGEKLSFESVIRYLKVKCEDAETPLTAENILPFDGNSAIGVEFLEKQDAVMCTPCKKILPLAKKSLKNHLTSFDHYDAVVNSLNNRNSKPVERETSRPNSPKISEKLKREQRETDDDEDDDDLVELIKSDDGHQGDEDHGDESAGHDDDDHGDDDEYHHGDEDIGHDDVEENFDDDGHMSYFDDENNIVLEEIGGEEAAVKDEEQ